MSLDFARGIRLIYLDQRMVVVPLSGTKTMSESRFSGMSRMVVAPGLEPGAFAMWMQRSNQLSYATQIMFWIYT